MASPDAIVPYDTLYRDLLHQQALRQSWCVQRFVAARRGEDIDTRQVAKYQREADAIARALTMIEALLK